MEVIDNPVRRQVGVDGPLVSQTLRITETAVRLIDELRKPGALRPEGCLMGDVVHQAIVEFNPNEVG